MNRRELVLRDLLNASRQIDVLAKELAGFAWDGSPELRAIRIDGSDVPLLAAFLRSLNEDYH